MIKYIIGIFMLKLKKKKKYQYKIKWYITLNNSNSFNKNLVYKKRGLIIISYYNIM